MGDPPETRDLFVPCDERRVPFTSGEALLIGHDLEADILITDDGAVVARLDERTWLINTSRGAYSRSLIEVGKARDTGGCSDALEARLREIDSDALDAPDSYWASIVEQIGHEQF